MPLEPVNHVLNTLRQTHWQRQRQFEQLVETWAQAVGPAVAAQTQPIQISAQRVLMVATASAVWAQNLGFERQRILVKLNDALTDPLSDIRFSTSQWRARAPRQQRNQSWTPKPLVPPSRPPDNRSVRPTEQDAQQAFAHWSAGVRSHVQRNPLCPQCQCPTPITELQRWFVCGLCWVRPPDKPA